MDKTELLSLSYLPPRLAGAVKRTATLYNCSISEIRLHSGRPLSLNMGGKNVQCGVNCSADEVAEVVAALCRRSLYSYSEEIREGVITTQSGIRAGVCGRATVRGGRIEAVRDITSVNIRIPHSIAGAADELYSLVKKYGSVLVYSPPGGGKTTALRSLIPLLSGGGGGRRVSVIDTRCELSAVNEGDGCDNADFFVSYPRSEGISAAVRTMSPEYIICDEIASAADADALVSAKSSGVNVVCSAHAGSRAELMLNKNIASLVRDGIFGCLYGIGANASGAEVCGDTGSI